VAKLLEFSLPIPDLRRSEVLDCGTEERLRKFVQRSDFRNRLFLQVLVQQENMQHSYRSTTAANWSCFMHFSLERLAAEAESLGHKASLQREQIDAELSDAIKELHSHESVESWAAFPTDPGARLLAHHFLSLVSPLSI
jgi:hypothetical protein